MIFQKGFPLIKNRFERLKEFFCVIHELHELFGICLSLTLIAYTFDNVAEYFMIKHFELLAPGLLKEYFMEINVPGIDLGSARVHRAVNGEVFAAGSDGDRHGDRRHWLSLTFSGKLRRAADG